MDGVSWQSHNKLPVADTTVRIPDAHVIRERLNEENHEAIRFKLPHTGIGIILNDDSLVHCLSDFEKP